MKNKFNSILLLCFIILFSCIIIGYKKPTNQNVYDFDGFDSLCVADSIPRNLNIWEKNDYYDEKEDKVKTKFHLNVGDTIHYIVFYEGDNFVVEKIKE